MTDTKALLRRQVRNLKAQATPQSLSLWANDICQRTLALPQWQEAHTLLLYHALPDEVNTSTLLAQALASGKQVLLPTVVANYLQLRHYNGHTAPGAFGIQEALGPVFTDFEKIDLAIVPGMAFDTAGHRLGRGRGYYDRLLPHLGQAHLVGLCFGFQLFPHIPSLPHDISMHQVLTE